MLLSIVAIHALISLTAARWWLRPLLRSFDQRYNLHPCKDSDLLYFCFTWSLVLVMMGLYIVWRHTVWYLLKGRRKIS